MIICEELEKEVRAALELIHAQFMLHQIRLEKGVFYFQWVHSESEPSRHPTKAVSKRLYLVYVKDLTALDKYNQVMPTARRKVQYHKDTLTKTFYQLILAHARLKIKEKLHTEICSCRIQLDM